MVGEEDFKKKEKQNKTTVTGPSKFGQHLCKLYICILFVIKKNKPQKTNITTAKGDPIFKL